MTEQVPKLWRDYPVIRSLLWLTLTFHFLTFAIAAHAVTPQQSYYDAGGRLIAVVDAVNGSAQYSYDATGNILSVTKLPYSALTVLQFSPVNGPAATTVTIYGTGFGTTANTTVKFNGVLAAAPTAVTATQITVKVPAAATSGPITVTSPAGTLTTTASFAVGSPALPTISGFSPGTGVSGDTVSISGANFDAANSKVYVNGRLASILTATATTLTAAVPLASSGHVSVETAAGAVTTASDLLIPPPGYATSAIGATTRSALGQSPSIAIGTAGQIGLILFDGAPGQRASFTLTTSTFSGGVVRLYGPNNVQLGPDAALTQGTFVFPQDLTVAGTYTLAVVPAAGVTGSATIALTSVPPVATSTMALDTTFTGTIATPGQNAGATFSATAGDRIALGTQIGGGLAGQCYTLLIANPDGGTKTYTKPSCAANDTSGELTLPATGIYTISYLAGSAATGSVTFSLSKTVTAAIASGGGSQPLTIALAGQNARATFSGTSGNLYSVAAVLSGGLAGQCFTLQLFKPDATVLFSQFYCGGTGTSGELTLPTTGTYSLRYTPNSGIVATGTVQLSAAKTVTASIGAAGAAPVLTIAVPGQIGRATFIGAVGAHYSVAVALAGGLAGQCFTMQVLKPDASVFFNQISCGAGGSGDLILPVAGTYTLRYTPNSSVVATGTAQLSGAPPVIATFASAGDAPVLTVAFPGQIARATFVGAVGDHYSVAVALAGGLASQCFTMQVLKPDESVFFSQISCGAGVSGDLTLPVAGTYTLRYTPNTGVVATGTAQLSGAPAVTASIGSTGAAPVLTIAFPGQVARASFTAAAGDHYGFAIATGGRAVLSLTPSIHALIQRLGEPTKMPSMIQRVT